MTFFSTLWVWDDVSIVVLAGECIVAVGLVVELSAVLCVEKEVNDVVEEAGEDKGTAKMRRR